MAKPIGEKSMDRYPISVQEQIAYIQNENSLLAINDFLIYLKTVNGVQSLTRDNHITICNRVVDVALLNLSSDENSVLWLSTILGRLSEEKMSKAEELPDKCQALFEQPPPSIRELSCTYDQVYAISTLVEFDKPWLAQYVVSQSLLAHEGEATYRILVQTALNSLGCLSGYLQKIEAQLNLVVLTEGSNKQPNTLCQLSRAIVKVAKLRNVALGDDVILALRKWFDTAFQFMKNAYHEETSKNIVTDVVELLRLIIEIRFSHALLEDTYSLLCFIQRKLTNKEWTYLIQNSQDMEKLREYLLESAIILARLGKRDRKTMATLITISESKEQLLSKLQSTFSAIHGIDPFVKCWWECGGSSEERSFDIPQHRNGLNDYQIGLMLLALEKSKYLIENIYQRILNVDHPEPLDRPSILNTVIELRKYMDETSETSQKIAVARKLLKTGLKGSIVQYNPLDHEMLGGHQLAIKNVKVMEDGIQKQLGHRFWMLVRPVVIPV